MVFLRDINFNTLLNLPSSACDRQQKEKHDSRSAFVQHLKKRLFAIERIIFLKTELNQSVLI